MYYIFTTVMRIKNKYVNNIQWAHHDGQTTSKQWAFVNVYFAKILNGLQRLQNVFTKTFNKEEFEI